MESQYTRTSPCGKYGLKPYGGESDGGQLWAWINTDFAENVGEIWDIDNFEIAIDEFELELKELAAQFGVEE